MGAMAPNSKAAAEPPARGRLLICVRGRVQGVGFRYAAARQAAALQLTGYVRNEADGSVAVVAEGAVGRLAELLAWLQQGPAGAHVLSVQHRPAAYRGEFRRFSVEY